MTTPIATIDWTVLVGTIGLIVIYGAYKTREVKSAETYLRGGSDLRWWTIGLSIMATQASAITFLSMPGQAYQDGMGFIQFYLGLPIAMIILSSVIVPIYYRLKVYTAYEYLETRFDRKTRQLVALLFLLSRGLGAGISLYAPAIVLSTLLGWPLGWTTLALGAAVILYTVSGGTRVVSRTQTWQMVVMLGGMAAAFAFVLHRLPPSVGLDDALAVGGALGKLKVIDFAPRFDTRYTFWSGITGGLFVQIAYFGTDQSQVQRYLTGSPLAESRLGLMFNGLVKLPMQFGILAVGLLLVVFYQFHRPPIFFNQPELARAEASAHGAELRDVESQFAAAYATRAATATALVDARHGGDRTRVAAAEHALADEAAHTDALRKRAIELIGQSRARAETKDQDYIFLRFVLAEFPSGLVGLLIAVILCAAMSATASALNSLGTTSVVDFYKRSFNAGADDAHYLGVAKFFTVFWGAVAVAFAIGASLFENLIQAVNILGSIFYGPMLGVFLVGFFTRRVTGTAAFIAVVLAQACVVSVWLGSSVGFLWYNVVGCAVVVTVALAATALSPRRAR
ncbi:MAG TPA: sodium:solute symporter [Polyangia bacterium]|jgi:Na+/proline symporter|nr:sodium:solute symporter [Polyangia bacterium]